MLQPHKQHVVLKVLTANMFFYAGTAHKKKAKISSVLMAKKPYFWQEKDKH